MFGPMKGEKMKNTDEELIKILPTKRQLDYLTGGFYGFVHFTVNTFTGREWGDGTESESVFDPDKLDTAQWVTAAKNAGMKGLILTCKHHDGFCLWPSRYTEHSIKNSPYKNGQGDIVRELSDECRRQGLRFGIYLSPWDRNCRLYGSGKEYDDYYIDQLTELLTGYGDIMAVWLDGACGEGPNGKKQKYDWDRYFETVRRLQPNAVISICGPDIRWCGNEAGQTRTSEWSVVPAYLRDAEKTSSESQKEDSTEFRERKLNSMTMDLGSREVVADAGELAFYPAEVDVSIRPGWFYHSEEDNKVKSVDELWKIYKDSVGGNCTLLLNIPPDTHGRFGEADVKALNALGEKIGAAFKTDLAEKASEEVIKDGKRQEHSLNWQEEQKIRFVVLKEDLTKSQRVEKFEILDDSKVIFTGTTIGAKKIVEFEKPVRTKKLTVKITDSRVCPELLTIEVY